MGNTKVLVTGGTGKTGSRLVQLLGEGGVPHRIASRKSAVTSNSIQFDWTDPATYPAALEGIGAVYLVAPTIEGSPANIMIEFCEAALAQGVDRFVLLSASLEPEGGPFLGQVHTWVKANAKEWAVLRPSWFMQNFSEGQHTATIATDQAIYSATGTSKVAFVDAADIAKSAFGVLTQDVAPNQDYVLTGPKAMSYDQIAEIISTATGSPVKHVNLSSSELASRYMSSGYPELLSQTLAAMDELIASGVEDRTTDDVLTTSGGQASSFEAFAQNAWRT